MNPKVYCLETGTTTRTFVDRAKEVAPKYSKITHSMASDPAYGVIISPELARYIRGGPVRAKRTKPCKFTFRLDSACCEAFNKAKRAFGHTTDQQAVEYAVGLYIKKAAEAAATDLNGTENTSTTNIHNTQGVCQDGAS